MSGMMEILGTVSLKYGVHVYQSTSRCIEDRGHNM
jgi:hypothetical protein